jgi:hypothetical protein
MNDDDTIDLDQPDQAILACNVSDDALEASGCAARGERMASMTASYLAGTIFVCC